MWEPLTKLIRTDLEELTALPGRVIEGGQAGPLPKLPFITYFWSAPRMTRRGYRLMSGYRAVPARPSLWPADERRGWPYDAVVQYDDVAQATLDIDIYAPRGNPKQAWEIASAVQRYFEVADLCYDIDTVQETWGKAVVRRVTPLIHRAIPEVATPYSRIGFSVLFHIFEALDVLERTIESVGVEEDIAPSVSISGVSYLDRIAHAVTTTAPEYDRYSATVKSKWFR